VRPWFGGGLASKIAAIEALRVAGPDAISEAVAAESSPTVVYIGPDLNDSAVRRRVTQWAHAGFKVFPFAFARTATESGSPPEFVNLGSLMQQSVIRRAFPIVLAAQRLVRQRRRLASAQLFVGRNLDNALLVLFARWVSGSSAPLVYEILDVNRACTDPRLRGALVRMLERWLLARVDLLIVSSPYFVTAYYQGMLGYRGDWSLFENKVPRFVHEQQPDLPPAPDAAAAPARPWRIGWFGYLDDERSWEILRSVAETLPKEVVIHVRGMPYLEFDMPQFLADVERLDNVIYGGPYRNPEDLAEVYNSIDLVWSTDCNVPTANSKWLLTNGLYEAGYFGKPVLGMAGNAVGEFVAKHGTGWCLQELVVESLINFIRELSPEAYIAKCREVLEMRSRLFIETDEIDRIWARLQARRSQRVPGLSEMTDEPRRGGIREISSTRARKLLFLGFFPPPVDGQRLITQRVFERFSAIAQVQHYNFDRMHALGPLSKLLSALGACLTMLRARAKGYSTLYLAPHSGTGLLFSCLIAFLGRCWGYSLAVHYHSYWNIGRRSLLMATFTAICGPRATHIVLAPPMERDLRRFYPAVTRVAAVSNCAFTMPRPETPRHFVDRRLRVGHLSNLSREKGIAIVLGCMRELRASGVDVELWLAGPAEDKATDSLIVAARLEFGERLRYFGRLDGEEVRRFYQQIDVFLFPSVHRHEAEPLVVIDAVAAGVPVIATDRGCIGYLLGTVGGRALPVEDFIKKAVDLIAAWAQAPLLLAEASRQARGRFLKLHCESQTDFERLVAMVLGGEPEPGRHDDAIVGAPSRQTGSGAHTESH
jgi:succinoglycan biosynthesis protein ExoL